MNGDDKERSGKKEGRSMSERESFTPPPVPSGKTWWEGKESTYTGDVPPGRAHEKEAVTVRRVSSVGGIVTFTIRIDLNRLAREGASESTSWHGKDPGSEQDSTSISRFFRTDSCSKPD